MRLLFILFTLVAASWSGYAQDSTAQMSNLFDLPLSGWNKVLQIRNGNTILFHFDVSKPVIIKIFDRTHKEIVSRKESFNILKLGSLARSEFDGFYDINGEAVFFISEVIENKHCLLRERINSVTGNIIEEKIVSRSASFGNRTIYRVLKGDSTDNYSVLCFRDIIHHPGSNIELVRFDGSHKEIDTIPIDVNVAGWKYISLTGCQPDKINGISVNICLSSNDIVSANAFYRSYKSAIVIAYLPPQHNNFIAIQKDLGTDLNPFGSLSSYNSFDNNLNLLLLSSNVRFHRNGLQSVQTVSVAPYYFVLNGTDMSLKGKALSNNDINRLIKSKVDSASSFNALPISMFTDDYGVTTVIYEDIYSYANKGPYSYESYVSHGSLGITQYDDKGGELHGTLLPKLYINSSIDPFKAQFLSTKSYLCNKSLYCFYNDYAINFNNSVEDPGEPVTDFTLTNGIVYKISKNNTVTKHYLYSAPKGNESKINDIRSADFNDHTNVYASVMLYRDYANRYSSCMVWRDLSKL